MLCILCHCEDYLDENECDNEGGGIFWGRTSETTSGRAKENGLSVQWWSIVLGGEYGVLRDKKERSRRGKICEDEDGDDRKDSGTGDYEPTTSGSEPKGSKARRVELRGRGERVIEH
jgi:hypothetical protein